MKRYISQMLDEYLARPLSPWHMPGHKRKPLPGGMWNELFLRDVTELPGTDDYHHATGGILLSMQEAARVYGSAYSHYLVGGATSGILAGTAALSELYREENDDTPVFLVAENVHRSVFHGLRLAGAEYVMVKPFGDPDYGPILPGELSKHLSGRKYAGCILTSPTYTGAISPLGEIKKILKNAGVPLFVDEAHGAHLPFMPGLRALGGIACGADLVVQSLHKTLPALTQTAILHVNGEGDRAARLNDRAGRALSVFVSSSPSYILMASAEEAVAWASENEAGFGAYEERIRRFRKELSASLNKLRLVDYPVFQDPTRITLCPLSGSGTKEGGMPSAAAWLEKNHGIVPEMAGPGELILISAVADSEEDLNRLLRALVSLDREFPDYGTEPALPGDHELPEVGTVTEQDIYAYPPGILLVRKGETVTEEALGRIRRELASGRRIHGIFDDR